MPKKNPKIAELELEVMSLRIELETEISKGKFRDSQIQSMAKLFFKNSQVTADMFDSVVDVTKASVWKSAYTLMQELVKPEPREETVPMKG